RRVSDTRAPLAEHADHPGPMSRHPTLALAVSQPVSNRHGQSSSCRLSERAAKACQAADPQLLDTVEASFHPRSNGRKTECFHVAEDNHLTVIVRQSRQRVGEENSFLAPRRLLTRRALASD